MTPTNNLRLAGRPGPDRNDLLILAVLLLLVLVMWLQANWNVFDVL